MPQKCLVAGLGNPLQGSDGFGPAVIERLQHDKDLPACIELDDAGTDLLALLDTFASFDVVVLVDALLRTGTREVTIVREEAFAAWAPHATNSHEVSPLLAVKLFRTLQPAANTRFILVGLKVGPEDFDRAVTAAEAQLGAEAVRSVLSRTV